VRCYEKHVEEHIRNRMGIHWELEENIVGTHSEREKNEKKKSFPGSPPPPSLKEKKARHLECMLGPSH
jgi:hypothetical protein